MAKKRPGTMFYFDFFYDFEDYTDEEVGKLVRAMLNYGLTGKVPEFSDRGMKSVWRKIKSKMDVDAEKYESKVLQRKYAAYCKKVKNEGIDPIPYEDWTIEHESGYNESITSRNEPFVSEYESKRVDNESIESVVEKHPTTNYQLPTTNYEQSTVNKKQETESHTTIHVQQSQSSMDTTGIHELLTPISQVGTSQSKRTNNFQNAPHYRPDWFDRFWNYYPNKICRVAAMQAWDAIRPDAQLCEIMKESIDKWSKTKQWKEKGMIPSPDKWLRDCRWTDEPPKEIDPDDPYPTARRDPKTGLLVID